MQNHQQNRKVKNNYWFFPFSLLTSEVFKTSEVSIGCHAEALEACGRWPLRSPFECLRVTPLFIIMESLPIFLNLKALNEAFEKINNTELNFGRPFIESEFEAEIILPVNSFGENELTNNNFRLQFNKNNRIFFLIGDAFKT